MTSIGFVYLHLFACLFSFHFPFFPSLVFSFVDLFVYWWLVRVTLVVDRQFLPQNFGLVLGTYEGLLLFCECTWGGGSIFRWWGHLNTFCLNRTFWPFCTERWWGMKNCVKLHGHQALGREASSPTSHIVKLSLPDFFFILLFVCLFVCLQVWINRRLLDIHRLHREGTDSTKTNPVIVNTNSLI